MTDLDFIPSVVHQAASRRHSAKMQSLWGIGLAFVMVLWLSMHRMEVSRAEEQLESARTEQRQWSDRQRFFEVLRGEQMQLECQAEAREAVNDRASLVTVMAELGALLPEGALLTELSLTAPTLDAATEPLPPPPPPSANKAGGAPAPASPSAKWPRLKIVGAAPSNVLVSTFTARMGGSALFRDVQASEVKDGQLAGRRVRMFSVECEVVPQKGGAR